MKILHNNDIVGLHQPKIHHSPNFELVEKLKQHKKGTCQEQTKAKKCLNTLVD